MKIALVLLGLCASVMVGWAYYFTLSLPSKVELKINNQYIIADTAVSELARAKGLSGRAQLNVNEGMFFYFFKPERPAFWMKDMHFPIDILWIANHRIVGIEENVDPQVGAPEGELKSYVPPEPVERVLELSAGRARLLNAHIGDFVANRPLVY